MKFKSLRGKLVFAITSLVVVVVMITGVVQYYQSWSQIFSEIQKRILSIAQTAASNVDGDECIFRSNSSTDSGANRPPIPIESIH